MIHLAGGLIINDMSENLIRAYIRAVLKESKEDVEKDEAASKNPIFWIEDAFQDPASWGAKNSFSAMRMAASDFGLLEIGLGSSRIVFEMGEGKVIKLARNEKGVEQNKLEYTAGRDPEVHDLLASVLDVADDYAWIIAEAVEPLDDGDVKKAEGVSGVPWIEVRRILGLSDKSEFAATAAGIKKKIERLGDNTGSSCLRGAEFIDALGGFLDRYRDMLPGDIVKLSSWGVNKKGCLVLLDYGITRKKFKELYN